MRGLCVIIVSNSVLRQAGQPVQFEPKRPEIPHFYTIFNRFILIRFAPVLRIVFAVTGYDSTGVGEESRGVCRVILCINLDIAIFNQCNYKSLDFIRNRICH